MSLPTETVSLAGSGLVFQNYYSDSVTDAYHTAIVAAEHDLQSHFTNPVTVLVSFDLSSINTDFAAHNTYNLVHVSYDTFVSALTAHATTADDLAAIAGLPASDPSHGAGFDLSAPQARILGLAQQTFSIDDAVVLNGGIGFNFGQDVVGALEHEMSEGVFGRIGSLGLGGKPWEPMDLFRFNAEGERDFTGGSDGVATYFGIDSGHVSGLQFHSAVNSAGVNDGFDLNDWAHAPGDAFGPNGEGSDGTLSPTDLQVLDVLGWTPSSASAAPAGGAAAGSGGTGSSNSAAASTLGTAGNDNLQATSAATDIHAGAGNDTVTGASVADYLRGDDGDDSIAGGSAFDDINGNAGADTLHGGAGDDWVVGGKDNDVQYGDAGDDVVWGNLGNDTLDGGDGNDQIRGGQGDDSLSGGSGADFISGDRGADTESGGAGADTFHFSQDAGVDKVLDFHYAEGDRVMLDPGTAYTLHQVGSDTIIDTGGGNEMILVGVQASSLPSDWIFGA